jgi:hypothetical protein
MSLDNEVPLRNTISSLGKFCWVASIGVWLCIVIRFVTDILARDLMWSDVFWTNFLFFFAAGIGVAATTHFAASVLPLLLGVMAITAHDVKAGWLWTNLYIVAAAAIGFFAGVIKLAGLSGRHNKNP